MVPHEGRDMENNPAGCLMAVWNTLGTGARTIGQRVVISYRLGMILRSI